jgi:hypothetical protein
VQTRMELMILTVIYMYFSTTEKSKGPKSMIWYNHLWAYQIDFLSASIHTQVPCNFHQCNSPLERPDFCDGHLPNFLPEKCSLIIINIFRKTKSTSIVYSSARARWEKYVEVQTDRFNWFWTESLHFGLFGLVFRFKNFGSVEKFS